MCSITAVFDEKIFGYPNEGYRPSINFLRDNIFINGKSSKKKSPKKVSSAEKVKNCITSTNKRLEEAITDGEIEKIIKKALPKQANQDSVVKQLADSFKEMLEDIKKPTDEVLIDLETKKPKRKREEGEKEGASSLTSLASSPLEPAVLSVPVAAEPENYLAGLGHDEDNEDNNVTAAEEAVSRSSKRQRKDPSKFDD